MTNLQYVESAHAHSSSCWWDHLDGRWVCPAPEDRPAPASYDGRPLVDVRDMIVVHTAMLREFRLAPAAVARTAVGDRKQAALVAGYVQLLCEMLHHHHEGEDRLLWPKLWERTSPDAHALIEEVEAQHEDLDAALGRVAELRVAWAAEPSALHRDLFADELATLHGLLRDHLDLEERSLLPLAAMVLTEAEWDEIGDAGAEGLPKSALALAFGMFAYEGEPAVLKDMLRRAPAVPRTVLPLIAPRIYARRARRVHGTATP